ncbi:MAG: ABC transporter ATP-binding protein [Gammaproteobacteria bacterium]|nr:ABC transporter ATP-binding protein [Gammaproteobacteria bacterium]
MSEIILENVTLRYPIYGASTRSFKHTLVNIATGGQFTKNNKKVEVKALDKISFALNKGDKLGLIGHNGAGKSTLLRTLAGIYEPQEGGIHVKGEISSLLDLHVGMQFESSGYENIRVRGLIMGMSKKETKKTIQDIEQFTELGDFLSIPVKTYSSGMIMRLAFGMSTSFTPDILLIDEVIGTGDANFMKQAHNRLDHFIAKSNILVLSSHSSEIIQRFCNKVLWLEHGTIKDFGATQEILAKYNAQY